MKSLGLLTTLLALGAMTGNTAKASLAVEYDSVGRDVNTDNFGSLFANGFWAGWSFTTNEAITVTALDAWNPDPNGTTVQLYSIIPGDFILGGGSLTDVASAVVTPSDPVEGSPNAFNSHSITPVTLHATVGDERYYIVEFVTPGISVRTSARHAGNSGVIADPSINYGYSVSGFAYPTQDVELGAFGEGYFGPNFDIAPATPEPASLLTLAGGLALLAFVRRKKGHRAPESA